MKMKHQRGHMSTNIVEAATAPEKWVNLYRTKKAKNPVGCDLDVKTVKFVENGFRGCLIVANGVICRQYCWKVRKIGIWMI